MRRLSSLLVVATLALLPLVTAHTAAADPPDASALIEQGLDLRQVQRDAEALVLFQRAEALSPSPRGKAQIALAEQALGQWASAEEHLAAALAAKDDPWISSRRPILERAMSVIRGHLGDVEIIGARAGEVYVDGAKVVGPSALTRLRLEVGRRTFELRAPGYYPISRILDVRANEIIRLDAEQHALLDASHETVVPPPPAAPTPPPRDVGRSQRTIGWVALGGAGLFVATGVVGLVDRAVAAGEFNGSASCTGTPSNSLSTQCRGWLDDGSTGQTLEIVGFVGGGVLTALSVALLLTAPTSTPKTTAWLVPCGPTRDGVGCSLTGSF